MSELSRRVLRASRHLEVTLDERALAGGVRRLEQRIARRKLAARASGVVAAAAAICLLVWNHHDRERASLLTADGSQARALARETSLVVERDTTSEVVLSLSRGAGRFEVTPNRKRRYRVRVGQVSVQVLGTEFELMRRAERVFVRVEHGSVQVDWPGGSSVLRGGDAAWFPPHAAPERVSTGKPDVDTVVALAAPEPQAVNSGEQAEPPLRDEVSSKEPSTRWRALARAGKHDEAFLALGQHRVDDLDGLLLAADAARLSGHPREAARHLTRLVERYPHDVRARLAAFTLGRLALHELGAPRLAAESFARAYQLDPQGELAEDALSREAEAYHRAGDAQRAARAAERYLARFPEGARRKELERYLVR